MSAIVKTEDLKKSKEELKLHDYTVTDYGKSGKHFLLVIKPNSKKSIIGVLTDTYDCKSLSLNKLYYEHENAVKDFKKIVPFKNRGNYKQLTMDSYI